MMLPGTLSSMEVLRRPPPASGRPRERPIALGSAGSRACSCPPRFAWPRSAGCADPCPCAPCRSCAGHGWRPGCLHKVEAMSDHLAGGGFYGRGSTKAGEGSVAPQSLGIVPGHDQQRPRVVGADSRQGEQLRGGICHQPIELDIQLGYLLREGLLIALWHLPPLEALAPGVVLTHALQLYQQRQRIGQPRSRVLAIYGYLPRLVAEYTSCRLRLPPSLHSPE